MDAVRRRSTVTGIAEVTRSPTGLRGLAQNKRCLGLALFASLGGVLYGYNQVRPMSRRDKPPIAYSLIVPFIQGVFGQVQVMQDFHHRYASTVSCQCRREYHQGAWLIFSSA